MLILQRSFWNYLIFASKRSICLLKSLSIISDKSTNIIIANPAKPKKQYSIGSVIEANEKRSFITKIANTNAPSIVKNNAHRIQLNGKETFRRTNKPANPVIITANVEISALLNGTYEHNTASITILKTMVKAPGMDFRITFTIYFPFILSLFGSKANIREGAPIVKALIRVN